jgi:hypothetical protein
MVLKYDQSRSLSIPNDGHQAGLGLVSPNPRAFANPLQDHHIGPDVQF